MKTAFNKIISLVYTFFLSINKNRRRIHNNKYLIVIVGHMGNAILIIDGLVKLCEYCRKNNKEISIACDSYMWKTLNNLHDLSECRYLEGVLVNNGRFFIGNLMRMHKMVKGQKYEKIITTLPINNVDHFLAITVPCSENICIKDDIERTKSFRTLGFGFIEKRYSKLIPVPVDMHETMRYKVLFSNVGVKNYQTTIHDLRSTIRCVNSKFIPNNKYITMALDSMNPNRRWRLSKFAKLIDMLLSRYSFDILLTGTAVDKKEYDKYIGEKINSSRVINLVGKTSFDEWLYILSKAEFHIGVDSGSIHFATSTGAQAYCITGVWDAHRVFPYSCEILPEGLHEPICVYRTDKDVSKMQCYACKVRGTEFGVHNHSCKQACKKGLPCECLDKVTPNDVLRSIINNYK